MSSNRYEWRPGAARLTAAIIAAATMEAGIGRYLLAPPMNANCKCFCESKANALTGALFGARAHQEAGLKNVNGMEGQ